MTVSASNTTNQITIRVTANHDCDNVQLFWRVNIGGVDDATIDGCLGFMIERQRIKNGTWGTTEILRNRVAFVDNPPADPQNDPNDQSRPSNVWPFQRFEWTDHGANNGQTVRYCIHAVVLPAGGTAGTSVLESVANSGWTDPIIVDGTAGEDMEAYFNRGFVMSQFMSRVMREKGWKTSEIKSHIRELEEPMRRFLSGELRLALLRLLDEVIDDPRLDFYAALYELSDDELIGRLKLLRGRAHIVLSNGSDESGDGNEASRKALKKAKVDVRDRILGTKGLGHNKFAIVVRAKDRKPLKAWTGSTNWAPTGLCTQVNNGLLLKDSGLAQLYLDQWDRLVEAEDGFPKELVAANAESPRNAGSTDVWFTRVRNKSKKNEDVGADIQALIDHVESAKSAILYVMFQPGPEPLQTILGRSKDVYVRGVVSTVIPSNKEKFTLGGIDMNSRDYQTSLIQPDGIGEDFGAWLKEVTRSEFMFPHQNPPVGHAITHSKMIVIDPFSDDCKVITGSHNFSGSASEKNDDNYVVVSGNRALAEAYAVACIATYEHYAWRAYVNRQSEAHKPIWSHLSPDPAWQKTYLTKGRIRHLGFWCP